MRQIKSFPATERPDALGLTSEDLTDVGLAGEWISKLPHMIFMCFDLQQSANNPLSSLQPPTVSL